MRRTTKFLCGINNNTTTYRHTDAATSSVNVTAAKSTFDHEVKDFWKDLALALEDARPHCSAVKVEDGHPTSLETTREPLNISKTPPERLAGFTDDHEIALFRSHYRMRASTQRLASRVKFSNAKQGIMATANAKYMPIFLVSLRMLRRTGCTLPVEVFIDDWTKYDPVVCETDLPSLDAACVVPLRNLRHCLEHPTAHHLPIQTLGTPLLLLPTRPLPRHRRLSRPRSNHTLLLMMVYSGPDYYYPLLCPGSHGAGDKETFVAAAMAVDCYGTK